MSGAGGLLGQGYRWAGLAVQAPPACLCCAGKKPEFVYVPLPSRRYQSSVCLKQKHRSTVLNSTPMPCWQRFVWDQTHKGRGLRDCSPSPGVTLLSNTPSVAQTQTSLLFPELLPELWEENLFSCTAGVAAPLLQNTPMAARLWRGIAVGD